MNLLRWIALHRRTWLAFSLLLALMAASLVAWQTRRSLEADRELPLIKSLGTLASTIEGGTTNSQAMGAATLFGLEHHEVKLAVLGQLRPDAPGILSGMDAIRRQFSANAVFLVNAQGIVVAHSDDDKNFTGRDISAQPHVQLALQGTPNVYPAMDAADRGIYLAAPVRSTADSKSRSIGVVAIKVGADKLDMVLDSWTEGVAVLLSPKGEIFSANRRDWIRHQGGKQTDTLPFTLDTPEATIEGTRYAVRSLPLEWHDPEGDWQLAVLRKDAPWWEDGNVPAFAGMAGLVVALGLFWLYTLGRHEHELLVSDALLRESQRIAKLGSYVMDIRSGLFKVSDETNKLFGIDETYEHSMAGWMALIHPDDRVIVESHFNDEVLGQGLPFDKEYRILRHNDHAERWIHGLGMLEYDVQGQAVKMHGSVQDITERKQAESALKKHHDRNQHYLDTTLALMVELDSEGRIMMINGAARKLLGYAGNELQGQNWFEKCLPQPEGMEVVYPVFLRLMAGYTRSSEEFENAILCRDGSRRTIVWRNTTLTDAEGKIVGTLSSGLDVTESKRLAQQLEAILKQSPTGIAVFSRDGPVVMANEAYAKLIGGSHAEALKQNFRNNASWQRNGLLNFANQAFETKATIRQDIEGVTSFGKSVALECIFTPISLSEKPHLLLLVNDVLDRVEARRALNESMHQLEQKELSKTRFLAAAGHDLRQPIAAANLYVDALKNASPTRRQEELILRLEQSMSVFSGLLDCLLDISKLDAGLIKPQLASFDLAELFDWLDQNFSQVARGKRLRLDLFFPENMPRVVRTDADLLRSVMMNLVSNAIKFTALGGILVSARPRGDSILLQVWDTGIGIPESHLPYIFDEFYQVSNPQRDREAGLGLGLSSCQRRMSLLGGKVGCRSRVGHGSVFALSLPLDKKPIAVEPPDVAEMPPISADATFASGKRVVVLEDDQLVSDAMRFLLQALGAKVRIFDNAEEALQHEGIGDADYFIVDHSLGGKLSGLQFLKTVQQLRQNKLRAVILTGETSSRFLSSVADSPWPVLNKPISIAALAAHLNR